jgi:hypothetical protein
LKQRMDPRGIMRLGDSPQGNVHIPVHKAGHLSLQYAGQPAAIASVSCVAKGDKTRPFTVFRAVNANTSGKLIGWEYCGQYELVQDNMTSLLE